MPNRTSVRQLERVSIGNDRQWVLVRGGRRDLPVLLHVQAGPGFPIIHEADALQKHLRWEDACRLDYWDMSGCGKPSIRTSFSEKHLWRGLCSISGR